MPAGTARRTFVLALVSIISAAALPQSGTAQAPAAMIWVTPAVHGYGPVHPRPDLLAQLMPGADYKVIVDVTRASDDRTQIAESLQRLARLANLFAYAGVPPSHVHIAAVIEERAGYASFSDAAYRARFKVGNPNLPLLHALKQAGVELLVCAQALAENGDSDGELSPDVTVTLSALTDFAIYGARGYSYLQL